MMKVSFEFEAWFGGRHVLVPNTVVVEGAKGILDHFLRGAADVNPHGDNQAFFLHLVTNRDVSKDDDYDVLVSADEATPQVIRRNAADWAEVANIPFGAAFRSKMVTFTPASGMQIGKFVRLALTNTMMDAQANRLLFAYSAPLQAVAEPLAVNAPLETRMVMTLR